LQFDLGGHGKPKLGAPSRKSRVAFNFLILTAWSMAVARFREVVSSRACQRGFAFDEVAERFFTAGEVAALRACGAPAPPSFIMLTSKEGFL